MPSLGDELRRYRELRGLTQEELAALVDPPLSPATISNLERGITRPHRHTLETLCESLSLDHRAREEIWSTWRHSVSSERIASAARRNEQPEPAAGQPTPLIGRQQELQVLQQRLLQPEVRLLTLVGPGGVGKTRLAFALMELVSERFRDGTQFVDLSALRDARLVVPTIARAQGIRDASTVPIRVALLESLRTRDMLLVLDNFEQVLDAASGLAELLGGCTHLKVIVTSREPIRSRWEHLHLVRSLATPQLDDQVSLECVRATPAVALFLERARAADDSFALTDANFVTIAALCTRLDGLPLALELAAARVRSVSPEMLLDHLDHQLYLLEGSRDAPPRQQSLRATLNWSYELLDEPVQALLRRLATFAGGCRLEAADAVCGEPTGSTLSKLVALVERSLLRQEESFDGTRRYRLLETVRLFALEQLHAHGEQAAFAERHARYYLDLAEEAGPHLTGARQLIWLNRLEEEHDNLRAALSWAVRFGKLDHALRLAAVLAEFWSRHGHLTEGRERMNDVLALANAALPANEFEQAHVRALAGAGDLALLQGDYVASRDLLERAFLTAQRVHDPEGVSISLARLGDVARLQGNYAQARSLLERSLASGRQQGNLHATVVSLIRLGDLARSQGEYLEARSCLEESLKMARDGGDRLGVAFALRRLGNLARVVCEDAQARVLLEESLSVARELGDRHGIASSLSRLGDVALRQGDYVRARVLLDESLAIATDIGDRAGIFTSVKLLADLAQCAGDYPTAQSMYAESLAIAQSLGNSIYVARSLDGMARLEAATGSAQRAMTLAGAAAAHRERDGTINPPADRQQLEVWLKSSRQALTAEEQAAAWNSGWAMSSEQAIAYAAQQRAPHWQSRR